MVAVFRFVKIGEKKPVISIHRVQSQQKSFVSGNLVTGKPKVQVPKKGRKKIKNSEKLARKKEAS